MNAGGKIRLKRIYSEYSSLLTCPNTDTKSDQCRITFSHHIMHAGQPGICTNGSRLIIFNDNYPHNNPVCMHVCV